MTVMLTLCLEEGTTLTGGSKVFISALNYLLLVGKGENEPPSGSYFSAGAESGGDVSLSDALHV